MRETHYKVPAIKKMCFEPFWTTLYLTSPLGFSQNTQTNLFYTGALQTCSQKSICGSMKALIYCCCWLINRKWEKYHEYILAISHTNQTQVVLGSVLTCTHSDLSQMEVNHKNSPFVQNDTHGRTPLKIRPATVKITVNYVCEIELHNLENIETKIPNKCYWMNCWLKLVTRNRKQYLSA